MPINSAFVSSFFTISNNFGDALAPWLIEKISKKPVAYVPSTADVEHFICGGSVLNHAGKRSVVWGAGIATITDGVNEEAELRAVRGPISRARALSCRTKCPPVYGEPALLLPRVWKPEVEQTHTLGIVPHYVDYFRVNTWWLGQYKIINVLAPIESVIREILSCKKIISSSLHGIVVAHAYGIPAAWAQFGDSIGGDNTKYRDYFASLGIEVDYPCNMRQGEMKIPDYYEAGNLEALRKRLWDACPFLP